MLKSPVPKTSAPKKYDQEARFELEKRLFEEMYDMVHIPATNMIDIMCNTLLQNTISWYNYDAIL